MAYLPFAAGGGARLMTTLSNYIPSRTVHFA
jgi:hypothetical protein